MQTLEKVEQVKDSCINPNNLLVESQVAWLK